MVWLADEKNFPRPLAAPCTASTKHMATIKNRNRGCGALGCPVVVAVVVAMMGMRERADTEKSGGFRLVRPVAAPSRPTSPGLNVCILNYSSIFIFFSQCTLPLVVVCSVHLLQSSPGIHGKLNKAESAGAGRRRIIEEGNLFSCSGRLSYAGLVALMGVTGRSMITNLLENWVMETRLKCHFVRDGLRAKKTHSL